MTVATLEIVRTLSPEALKKVLIHGDLARLTQEQRADYMASLCSSLGLNALSRPFDFIELDGRLRCYATRDCTDQLRKIYGVSIAITAREFSGELYIVTAQAQDARGRRDESIGVVVVEGLMGVDRANALMTCETKAKRRVTLSICGLGMLDETEVETVTSRPREAFAPPPRQRRGTSSGASEVKYDEPATEEQLQTIAELQREVGGKWITGEGDPRTDWRKLIGVYRGPTGERIETVSALGKAQATHLIARGNAIIEKRERYPIEPLDIGALPDVRDPDNDEPSASELEELKDAMGREP